MTIPLDQLITEHGLTMDTEWAASNPHMADMPRGSSHWLCTVGNAQGETMEIRYSMGPALTGEPELPQILDTLASDISSVRDSPDWLDWAEEFGYEGVESLRSARSAHQAITQQGEDLERLIGHDALETLLWDTERL